MRLSINRSQLKLAILGTSFAGLVTFATAFAAPAPQESAKASEYFVKLREFQIPFNAPASKEISSVRLFVSPDEGKSWQLHETVPRTSEGFSFRAAAEGRYLFQLQTVNELGESLPTNQPPLQVIVDTTAPTSTVETDTTSEGRLKVNATASDTYLNFESAQMRYRTNADTAWRLLPIEKFSQAGGTGHFDVLATPPPCRRVEIEFSIEDRAGNLTRTLHQMEMPRTAMGDRELQLASSPIPQKPATQPSTPQIGGMRFGNDTAAASPFSATQYNPNGQSVVPNNRLYPRDMRNQPLHSSSEVWSPESSAQPYEEGRSYQGNSPATRNSMDRELPPDVTGPARYPTSTFSGGPATSTTPDRETMRSPNATANDGRYPVDRSPGRFVSDRQDQYEELPAPKEFAQSPAEARPQAQAQPPMQREQQLQFDPLRLSGPQSPASQSQQEFYTSQPMRPDGLSQQQSYPPRTNDLGIGRTDSGVMNAGDMNSGEMNSGEMNTGEMNTGRQHEIQRFTPGPSQRTSPADLAHHCSSRSFFLEYDLASEGSQVQHVELWATEDEGKTWTPWGEDLDRTSPAELIVGRDGVFGFQIVTAYKNGQVSARPTAGSEADAWINVDTTEPQTTITRAVFGDGAATGILVIDYTCSDAHLTERPIMLSYARSLDGPWQPIATGQRNQGTFAWKVPNEIPERFYLKIEAVDKAGNVGAYRLEMPIDSQGRVPTGRILRIRPIEQ